MSQPKEVECLNCGQMFTLAGGSQWCSKCLNEAETVQPKQSPEEELEKWEKELRRSAEAMKEINETVFREDPKAAAEIRSARDTIVQGNLEAAEVLLRARNEIIKLRRDLKQAEDERNVAQKFVRRSGHGMACRAGFIDPETMEVYSCTCGFERALGSR